MLNIDFKGYQMSEFAVAYFTSIPLCSVLCLCSVERWALNVDHSIYTHTNDDVFLLLFCLYSSWRKRETRILDRDVGLQAEMQRCRRFQFSVNNCNSFSFQSSGRLGCGLTSGIWHITLQNYIRGLKYVFIEFCYLF